MTAVTESHLTWRVSEVTETEPMTARAHLIRLSVPAWPGNDAGQHVDLRLTSSDGYQATRSYSLASIGDEPRIELLVARLDGGEVSGFLNDELRAGDQLEVLGPLGRWFIWTPSSDSRPRPVALIAGGSGVVPIVSILRARREAGSSAPMRLLYSVRSPDDVLFPDELSRARDAGVPVDFAYTRSAPVGMPVGRVDRERVLAVAGDPTERAVVYVCGTTAFVETVLDWLTAAGHRGEDIRAERFGG